MPYVISTLGQSQDYTFYDTIIDGKTVRHTERQTIHVNGGQGVMEAKALVTPEEGVVTEITDAEAELLKTHPDFLKHEASGNVRIVRHKLNVGRIVEKDMSRDDDSAQLTPEDFGEEADATEASGSELKFNNRKVAAKRGTRSSKIK